MALKHLQSSPKTSQQKGWKVVNANHNVIDNKDLSMSKTGTKLLFNEAVPLCVRNRVSCVDPPATIVIEKLLPLQEEHNLPDSTKSSISFTVLSEERLDAAVKLAKRDLRRRRLETLSKFQKHSQKITLLETSDVELLQDLGASPSKIKLKASSPKEQVARTRSRLGRTSHNRPTASLAVSGQSPLIRDHGSQEIQRDTREIHRLQLELELCIQNAEEKVGKEQKWMEPLEPEEQSKLNIRKQKQAARSTSIIYALQQQVKQLQENLQQAHCQKTKSTSLQRLAAAHRGVIRALHGFIQQLSDTTDWTNPPHFKDLGQLIRQLCLCSANVESPVSQSALSILQKLEVLNSALSKQAILTKMQVPTCPPPGESHQGANAFVHQAVCQPIRTAKNIKGKKKVSRKPKSASNALTHRRHLLRAGLERLAQQREQGSKDVAALKKPTLNKKGVYPEKDAPLMKAHSSRFLKPTVSSRLRENQLPQREQSVPWIPTSPHSPPRPRPLQQKTRPEPRCLFPSEENPPCSPKLKVTNEAKPLLVSEKEQQALEEAKRRILLDKMTMQRLKELQQLREEDEQHLHISRSEVESPAQWAEGAEQKETEIMQLLLDQAHQFDASRNTTSPSLNNRLVENVAQGHINLEQLSEALLEDLLKDTARAAWSVEADRQLDSDAQLLTQTGTLENMLLRMEEIQKDQEEVRRRVTTIIYSDPLNWSKPKDTGESSGSMSCFPQPIRLTRPELKPSPAAEIILGKPLETGVLLEAREAEVSGVRTTLPDTARRSRGAVLSVPRNTLRSIRQYREDFEAYCRSVALKATAGVSSWAFADSLAEELLLEALKEVAAEFQDVVEECAEAVFTSEFLQPVQSPPPSAVT